MNNKVGAILTVTGAFAGLGIFLGSVTTNIVLSGHEGGIDKRTHEDVVKIVDKIDRVLLAQGTSSFTKDITDLGISYDLESPATSLQMSGTFKDGYCIRVTNPGGLKTEAGKTYSISAEGELNAGTPRCNTAMENAPVISGPAIDENSKTEWEMINTSYSVLIGSGGTLIAGALGLLVRDFRMFNKTRRNQPDAVSVPVSILPIDPEKNMVVTAVTPEATSTAAPDALSALNIRIANVKKEWSSYEMDLVKILDYPAVANMSFPATSDFHKAMRNVNVLISDGVPVSATSLSVLSEAVLDLEHKFDVMIAEAKRSKWSTFSDDERISLRTAQNLLSIAINAASSPNERQIAYKRLIREVEGILAFPEKALLELEARIAPAICESKIETNMVTA